MKKIFSLVVLLSSINLFGQQEIYELKVYELFQSSSIKNFNAYFEDHYIPTLSDKGIQNIGVFSEVSEDLPRKIYVFVPYANMEEYQKVTSDLSSDAELQQASSALNPVDKPMFNRYQTSLYIAFVGMPKMIKPDNKNRFYELRTYESHSEDAYRRKVNMFNEGELDLFAELDFGSVFWIQILDRTQWSKTEGVCLRSV